MVDKYTPCIFMIYSEFPDALSRAPEVVSSLPSKEVIQLRPSIWAGHSESERPPVGESTKEEWTIDENWRHHLDQFSSCSYPIRLDFPGLRSDYLEEILTAPSNWQIPLQKPLGRGTLLTSPCQPFWHRKKFWRKADNKKFTNKTFKLNCCLKHYHWMSSTQSSEYIRKNLNALNYDKLIPLQAKWVS